MRLHGEIVAPGDEGEERVRGLPATTYARLAALKRRYYLDNLFGLNQNIRLR